MRQGSSATVSVCSPVLVLPLAQRGLGPLVGSVVSVKSTNPFRLQSFLSGASSLLKVLNGNVRYI